MRAAKQRALIRINEICDELLQQPSKRQRTVKPKIIPTVEPPPEPKEEPQKEETIILPPPIESPNEELPLPMEETIEPPREETVEPQKEELPLPREETVEPPKEELPLPKEETIEPPKEETSNNECIISHNAVDPYQPSYSQAVQYFGLSYLTPSKTDLLSRYREIALKTHPDRAKSADDYDTFCFATACKVKIFHVKGWVLT